MKMNTKTIQTRAQRTKQVQDMTILSMFTAILFLLTFTPLGLVDLPVIKATVLHVPVIIGSILLGPRKGWFPVCLPLFFLPLFLSPAWTGAAYGPCSSALFPGSWWVLPPGWYTPCSGICRAGAMPGYRP